MRAIYDYHGFPAAVAALKLVPLVFAAPVNCEPQSGRKSTWTRRNGGSLPPR